MWFWLFLGMCVVSSNQMELSIQGTTAEGWEFVRDFFKQNFEQDKDLGASVAIYHQGKLVVDLWGGWFDKSRTTPYNNDSLQLVFSTSKGLVAAAVALCVQRGLLDYSALVTRYWPEYGQNGKENTTVAEILSHRAGLPSDTATFEQFLNWTAMIQSLEQRRPEWPPGTQQVYHALTYGWLAGELVVRVDPLNRTFGQFVRDEIATPLELEFYIGLPPDQEYRVSPLYLKSNENGTSNDSTSLTYDAFNQARTHQAEIPAANGITNARSVARMYAALIGDVEGSKHKRILSEEILRQATTVSPPTSANNSDANIPIKLGMGFFLMDAFYPSLQPGVFGHTGSGGSVGFAAPEKNFSFAYVMNRMYPEIVSFIDARYKPMLDAITSKLNSGDANTAVLGKRFSTYSVLFCVVLFYVGSNVD